jgi:transposase
MWTAENRGTYERKGQRYPSDVSDEEWAFVEPHLPPQRRTDRREVLNAILYVLTTGCQWKQPPKDFPPKSTVHDYFVEWHCDGTLTRIHHALYAHVRELAGREPTATTVGGAGSATWCRWRLAARMRGCHWRDGNWRVVCWLSVCCGRVVTCWVCWS